MPNPKRFLLNPKDMDAAVNQALHTPDAEAALRRLAWETQWGPKWRGEWRCCATPMTLKAATRIYTAFPEVLGQAFAPHLRNFRGGISLMTETWAAKDFSVVTPILAGWLARSSPNSDHDWDLKQATEVAKPLAETETRLGEVMAATYGLKWELQGEFGGHARNALRDFFFARPPQTWLANPETLRAMLTARASGKAGGTRAFVVEHACNALASRDPRAATLAAEHVDLLLRRLEILREPSAMHLKALRAAACDEKAARKIIDRLHVSDWALALKAQILHMHPPLRKPSEQSTVYRKTA